MTVEQQVQMFGKPLADVKQESSLTGVSLASDLMYAMAILSDAQAILAAGSLQSETARQWINKAKYWISNVQQDCRTRGL